MTWMMQSTPVLPPSVASDLNLDSHKHTDTWDDKAMLGKSLAFYLVNEQGSLNDRMHMISHSLVSTCLLSYCYMFGKELLLRGK